MYCTVKGADEQMQNEMSGKDPKLRTCFFEEEGSSGWTENSSNF